MTFTGQTLEIDNAGGVITMHKTLSACMYLDSMGKQNKKESVCHDTAMR